MILLALYNVHSYAIRTFHSILLENGIPVESVYFKTSTYTDLPPTDAETYNLVEYLKGKSPKIIAVSVHSPIFPLFKKVSERIRTEIPNCKIAIGGEHATADPESCLSYADYVVVGEGEKAIVDLARGDMPEGMNFYCPTADLDSIPIGHYGIGAKHFGRQMPKLESYLCGRGCVFDCSFCQESIRDRSMVGRIKSVEKVISDIKKISNIFNTKGFFFSDSIFTLNSNWLERFCEEYAKLNFTFSCYGHSTIKEETIKMLKEAGLVNYRIGVQSGCSNLRSEIFNRKDNLENILSTSYLLEKHGVVGLYDFIFNNPYDDMVSLSKTRNFIRSLPTSSVISNFELRWFPNTPLTKKALCDMAIQPKDVEGQFNRFGNWDYTYTKA